ncbi:UNVERIFIED_CONTAM: hypothetical protein HDU68_005722 [Siphonaria sp. JEL0065]|nr:hypothetical protein HDU68_005722 [Siphonaria sp. JEL0065]
MDASLLAAARNKLKPAETIETSAIGVKTINGVVLKGEKAYGFVEDTTVDLEIAPILSKCLFVSSIDAALNMAQIEHYGIELSINLSGQSYSRPGWTTIVVHNLDQELDLSTIKMSTIYEIECLDLPEQYLSIIAEYCCSVITAALDLNLRVLIHCQMGASRSVSVILWYLITRKQMRLEEALAFVKEKRKQAQPNSGFMKQLRELDKKLFLS